MSVQVLFKKRTEQSVCGGVSLRIHPAERTSITTKLNDMSSLWDPSRQEVHESSAAVECALLSGIGFALGKLGALYVSSRADGIGYSVEVERVFGSFEALDSTGFAVAATVAVASELHGEHILTEDVLDGWECEVTRLESSLGEF